MRFYRSVTISAITLLTLASSPPGSAVELRTDSGPSAVGAAAMAVATRMASSTAAGNLAIPGATYTGRFINDGAMSFTVSADGSGITSASYPGPFSGFAPGTIGGTCRSEFEAPLTFSPPVPILSDGSFSREVPEVGSDVRFSGSFDGPQSAKGTLYIGWDPGDEYRCEIGEEPWTATTTSAPPLPPKTTPPKLASPKSFRVLRAGVKRGVLNMLVKLVKTTNDPQYTPRKVFCDPALGNTRKNCTRFLYVGYRSSGRTTKFRVWVNSPTLNIRRELPRKQRTKNIGIVTLTYPASASSQRYSVRLRIQGQRFTVLRAG